MHESISKWNRSFISLIANPCVYPDISCQNGHCENGLLFLQRDKQAAAGISLHCQPASSRDRANMVSHLRMKGLFQTKLP